MIRNSIGNKAKKLLSNQFIQKIIKNFIKYFKSQINKNSNIETVESISESTSDAKPVDSINEAPNDITPSEPNKEIPPQEDFKQEIIIKTFHILTILVLPIFYIFTNKEQILTLLFPLAILIIAADFYRHKISFVDKIFHAAFGHILRQSELVKNSRSGASYMAMAALLVFTLCPKIIAICAFSILAVSNCLAALIGKKITSKKFFEKSVAGSVAFGISAFAILLICGIFTDQGYGFYLFGILAVFAVTILEARPSLFSINDNFMIPVLFGTIMTFFGFVWGLNYQY